MRSNNGAGVSVLLHEYQQWLRGQQQQLEAQYGLDVCDWEISQETGLVTYRRGGRVVVRATYVMIGSYCALNGTWLWAWANPAVNRSYAIHPQQTLMCAQRVGALGLAQPLVSLQEYAILWQDCHVTDSRTHVTSTALGRLVSMMAHVANGIGVQYYRNPATKTMGWVALQCIYQPVESV